MKLLRNYVLREMAGPFILSLSIFVFILLIGNLIQTADKVIGKGTNLIDVLWLFVNWIPYLLRYALPMSLLTSILLTFGRFSSDNEIIAMRASGFSLYRVIYPIIVIALIFSLFSVILNDEIIPRAHFTSRKILAKLAAKNPVSCIEDGTFMQFKKHIIFVDKVTGKKLKGIKIFETEEGKPPRTIIAKEGEFVPAANENAITLRLIGSTSDSPDENNPSSFHQFKSEVSYITLNLLEGQPKTIQKKPKDMTMGELKKEVKNLQRFNINPVELVSEIHKKISLSFANLAFVIIGLPLAIKTKKSSKSAGFGLSLAIIIAYYVLLALGNALAVKGMLAPAFGAWFPNIITIGVGSFLIYQTIER